MSKQQGKACVKAVVLPETALASIIAKDWPGDPAKRGGTHWGSWLFVSVPEEITARVGQVIIVSDYNDNPHPHLESILRRAKELGIEPTKLETHEISREPLWSWIEGASCREIITRLEEVLEKRKEEDPYNYGVELDTEPLENVEIEWLLPNKILPAGLPCLLRGREGTGKTTLALFLCAEVVKRTGAKVLWIAAEAPYDTKQKLAYHFPDIIPSIPLWRRNAHYGFSLENPEDLEALGATLKVYPNIQLVVLDSLRASLKKVKETEVSTGNLIRQLASIVCDRYGRTLLILHHEKKGESSKRDKFSGSPDIIAAIRWELIITPASQRHRIVEVGKSNLPISPPGPWGIVKAGNTFAWAELPESEETLTQRAERLIWEALEENSGEAPAAEVYSKGEEAGIDPEVLKKVKQSLGIRSEKRGNRWFWVPPFKTFPSSPSFPLEGVTPCKIEAFQEGRKGESRGKTAKGAKGEKRDKGERELSLFPSNQSDVPSIDKPLPSTEPGNSLSPPNSKPKTDTRTSKNNEEATPDSDLPTPPPKIEDRLDELAALDQLAREAEEAEREGAISEEGKAKNVGWDSLPPWALPLGETDEEPEEEETKDVATWTL